MSFWTSLQPERIELMCLPDVCQLLKSYDRYLFKVLHTHLLVVRMLLRVCVFLLVLRRRALSSFCAVQWDFNLFLNSTFWLLLGQPRVWVLVLKEPVEFGITSILLLYINLKVPNINGLCCYKYGLWFWHEVMWLKFQLMMVFQIMRVTFPLRALLHFSVTFHMEICSFLIKIICFLFPEVIKYCLEINSGSNIYS